MNLIQGVGKSLDGGYAEKLPQPNPVNDILDTTNMRLKQLYDRRENLKGSIEAFQTELHEFEEAITLLEGMLKHHDQLRPSVGPVSGSVKPR